MTDVFDQVTDNSEGDQAQSEGEILASLVGEDKTFKTVEALAKGKSEADKFIEKLQAENAEMRESVGEMQKKNERAATIDDIMELVNRRPNDGEAGNQSETISKEDVQALVREGLKVSETDRTRRGNREKANVALLQKFDGDAALATAHLESKSVQIGMPIKSMLELAETSPTAFQTLVGIEQTNPSPTIRSTVNTDGTGPASQVRDAAYYRDLKAKIGDRAYFEPRLQNQMMRDAEQLGVDKFLNKG